MLNPLAAPGDFMGSDTSLRSRPQPQRQCLQGQPGPPEPRLKHRCWLLGGCARVSRDGAGWGSRERSGEQGANPQRSWAWGSCDVCSRFSQFAQSFLLPETSLGNISRLQCKLGAAASCKEGSSARLCPPRALAVRMGPSPSLQLPWEASSSSAAWCPGGAINGRRKQKITSAADLEAAVSHNDAESRLWGMVCGLC